MSLASSYEHGCQHSSQIITISRLGMDGRLGKDSLGQCTHMVAALTMAATQGTLRGAGAMNTD